MNKMMGVVLMGIGLIVLLVGAFIYRSDDKQEPSADLEKQISQLIDLAVADGVLSPREEQKIMDLAAHGGMDGLALIDSARARIKASPLDSETEIIDQVKKSGDDFEKFIVQKFNRNYFNVLEWAGDKYIDGIYADTTLHPDLKMELKLKNGRHLFYVECKWRGEFKEGAVEFAKQQQFERYKLFEEAGKIPVFIALGIGGRASSPEQLYTFPLRNISTNTLTIQQLERYKRKLSDNFYFDTKEQTLGGKI